MYSYAPLWRTMKEKNVSTYRLIQCGIDKHTIYNLQHGKNVTVATLERLCDILGCDVNGVIEVLPEQSIQLL